MSISHLKTLPRNVSLRNNLIKQISCLFASKRSNYSTLRRSNQVTNTVEAPNEKEDFIRMIFDDTSLWRSQSKSKKYRKKSGSVGLFENPHFADIHGINYAAQQAIQRAQIIVERICNAPQNGPEEMKKIVKNLDRLSDTLCTVIDMAEFVRNAHPDGAVMEAANKAYVDLCSYMNTLNTDTRLHQVYFRCA
jgi:intermediate peptidase